MPHEDLVRLLERSYATSAEVFAALPADRLDAPSPCEGWTVRQVADHLVDAMQTFARLAEGKITDAAEFTAQTPEVDHLLPTPEAAFCEAAGRCVVAFGAPGVFEREFPFPFGPTPGFVVANISMSEALVHGWDIAHSAGLRYTPDDEVVDAVARFQSQGNDEDKRQEGLFGPAVAAPPDASPFAALLAHLGRRP